jgi:hypothetical protein
MAHANAGPSGTRRRLDYPFHPYAVEEAQQEEDQRPPQEGEPRREAEHGSLSVLLLFDNLQVRSSVSSLSWPILRSPRPDGYSVFKERLDDSGYLRG